MKKIVCWGALMVSLAASADAVIWYRFDDQEPLTSTAGGVYVTNCVAATYPAHPRTIHGSTYDDENSPNTAYLPTYTNSAPAGYGVYDPVTGVRVANRGCLHFHTTGSGDQNGGMLRVTQDAALNALTNLTLEAFVRLGDVPITGSYMRPIILKANQGFQGTWGLHVFESNLFYRVTYVLDDGSQASQAWGNGAKSARIDDGRWHHLAVTFDFGAKKVQSYVDYVRIASHDMNARAVGFYHPSNSPLQIGGNASHTTRRHNGEIDEVRISDEALPPEKFLRYIPMREIDGDTMYYLPFDAGAEDWFSTTAPPINAATNNVGTITMYKNAVVTDMPTVTNDVPGESIRSGVYSADSAVNGGAIHLPVTGEGAHNGVSFLLTDPQHLITASNFTYEVFVKTDRQTTKPAESEYADSFCIFQAGYMKILMNGSNKQLLFRYVGSLGMQDKYVPRIDDGHWHHIAYVHDAAEETVTGYVDYKQVMKQVMGKNGSNTDIHLSGENSGYQTLPGCLDEVRITRRALKVTDFLTTHGCLTGTTLAHADFEEDMNLSPDTGLIASGDALARAGGSVPVLGASVPGVRIALDGASMQDVRDNKKSLRIDGGKIGWTDLGLLRKPSFTVEFFAKLEHLDYVANLIRLNRDGGTDGTPAWALFTFANGTADQLTVCAQDANELFYFPAHPFASSIADGRWHHWALTFDGTSGTNTVITLYRDYVSQESWTLTTPINYLSAVNSLSIGGTATNPAHIRGNFDELRVSEGVLPTDKFMRVFPTSTVLLVR